MSSPGNPAYKDTWLRCNGCRTRRKTVQLLLRHVQAHPECLPCSCSGYEFIHRKGSGACVHRADQMQAWVLLARRRGEDELTAMAEYVWDHPGIPSPGDPPF